MRLTVSSSRLPVSRWTSLGTSLEPEPGGTLASSDTLQGSLFNTWVNGVLGTLGSVLGVVVGKVGEARHEVHNL